MDEGALGRWLTLDELASRTGRKATGLRTWAQRRRREGRHAWRKSNAGQWTVQVSAELLAELERGADEGASLGDEGVSDALDEARAEVAHLREALSEARVSQAKAEGKLEALERAHAAELAAVRELVTELRTMLAEARRPWWRRVVGK